MTATVLQFPNPMKKLTIYYSSALYHGETDEKLQHALETLGAKFCGEEMTHYKRKLHFLVPAEWENRRNLDKLDEFHLAYELTE
jgi:hypothetical protein